jgi:hypothetical protein
VYAIVRRIAAISPVFLFLLSSCLPYTVGTTARTVPVNETTNSTSYYFIPNAVKSPHDTIAVPLAGADYEMRFGIDSRSDVGGRILPGGVAIDYKRRIDSDVTGTGTAVAYMIGGGIVNGGEHFMLQATLIASAREDVPVAPFGGLRAIQVMPISEGAVSDKPTIGAFGGAQVGNRYFTLRPELGIFYDHSALGVRKRDVIFVPAITIQRRRREDADFAKRPVWRGAPPPSAPRAGCDPVSCAPPGGAPRRRGRLDVP